MKRITLIYVAAGLLACGPALRAEPPGGTNQPPAAVHRNPDARAQNQRVLQIVGLSRADLKGLTPVERREKLKTAVASKISELKQKQTDGSITVQEKSDLAFLESRARHGGKKAGKAPEQSEAVPPVQSQAPQTQSQ